MPISPRTAGATTMASDQTWWCEDRLKGAWKSPESSSVT
jgi:hypothetical protein